MSIQEDTYDGITPKEVILKIKDYFNEVLRNWKLVFIVCTLFVALFVGMALLTKPIYKANLTFMLSEDKSSGGGISALFGQFIGGGGGGKNNLDKLLELSKSRRIMQEVLFRKSNIKGREDYLANHLIDFYEFHERWADDTTGLENFYFERDSIDGSNMTENKAFKQMYGKMVGNESRKGMFNGGYGEETNILNFSVNSLNESLSIDLCNAIYESIALFYVAKTTEKQQQTYDIVKEKMDSISNVIAFKENQLANFKDSNRGIWSNSEKLKERKLEVDLQLLYKMLGVAIENHEISAHNLKSQTPFVQLIDRPLPPIKPEVSSKLKALLLGGIAGGFLSVFFILARKIYRDIMA